MRLLASWRPRPHPIPVWVYIATVTGVAIVLTLNAPLADQSISVLELLLFLILAAVVETMAVRVPNLGAVSATLAVQVATVGVIAGREAVIVMALAMVAAKLLRRQPVEISVLNGAFAAIELGAALQVIRLLRVGQGFAYPEDLVALFLAGGVKLVVNIFLVNGIILLDGKTNLRTALRSGLGSILVPYVALMPMACLMVVIYYSPARMIGILLFLVPLLFARYSFLAYLELRQSHLETVEALAAALDAKDSYSKGHSDRVAKLAKETAEVMGLRAGKVEEIEYAGRLHDIGKIGVPDALLNKPGPLTAEELSRVRQHATLGADMIKPVSFLRNVAEIVRYHHEWYDGGGYPGGLREEQIPIGARILAVCDAWDAMTTDRSYRRALDPQEALQRLRAGAGTQFDPRVVEAFTKVLARRQAEGSSSSTAALTVPPSSSLLSASPAAVEQAAATTEKK
ncbi:MAG: HD-GYP domain-containing protein [Limnochordales bacterium]|nr:HD-GYP domain-containing protein [Limnochordales bacterium]